MAVPAKVQDLVEALDLQDDRSAAFFDSATGETHVISHDVMRIAESEMDAGHMPLWEAEEVEFARRVLDDDRYIELPASRDMHEWRIMEAFCYTMDDVNVRADFLRVVHSRRAFRHFKERIHRAGLGDSWFAFRTDALRKIAIDWCEEHQIAHLP